MYGFLFQSVNSIKEEVAFANWLSVLSENGQTKKLKPANHGLQLRRWDAGAGTGGTSSSGRRWIQLRRRSSGSPGGRSWWSAGPGTGGGWVLVWRRDASSGTGCCCTSCGCTGGGRHWLWLWGDGGRSCCSHARSTGSSGRRRTCCAGTGDWWVQLWRCSGSCTRSHRCPRAGSGYGRRRTVWRLGRRACPSSTRHDTCCSWCSYSCCILGRPDALGHHPPVPCHLPVSGGRAAPPGGVGEGNGIGLGRRWPNTAAPARRTWIRQQP